MPSSIGVNLRVTGHCSQGARKYMEDMFSVAYQRTEDEKDLEYAFFGIFDGHGGQQAATFAKEHLLDNIVNQKSFWSDKDAEVLRAIRDGFLQTHLAMWRQLDHWPKTAVGFPSTSGTTASIAFIRRGKIYIGHVGDSSIVLGYQEDGQWKGLPLTRDHKPESEEETQRIEQAGGKVVKKSGVPRVVWNRPRLGHQGPVRRSTQIDEIPFLAVARSLGDLWSYNPVQDVFVVSPEPDVSVYTIDVSCHRCLIFGTDGLWNVMCPTAAVEVVQIAESRNEQHLLQQGNDTDARDIPHAWINPSKSLVDRALEEWRALGLQADNTSVVTLMLDPPGPPRVQVLLSQRQQQQEILEHSSVSSLFSSRCVMDIKTKTPTKPTEDLTPPSDGTIHTRTCDPASLPDSSCGNQSISSDSKMPFPSPPMSLMCLQSNEVSSSSTVAAVSTSTAIKTVSSPVNRDKSCLPPTLGMDLSKAAGFKRRHSSGLTQPHMSGIDKRKRTRSEHDCFSKEQIRNKDLATSDAENQRVAWPPWNAAKKANTSMPQKASKYSGPRCGKSMLPLVTPIGKNANSRWLCSNSSVSPPKWTLRSRNVPSDQPPKLVCDDKTPERIILPAASNLCVPMTICTRSKGRKLLSCNK
ncbi:hypothetical protein R5R35_007069 [Gryllus longicercus]|uniref:PPM-type phosphatase domain-containing protein n=1 Tax=Gryllus longicercus TaxID=2509291 RepID=A0AAN9VB70_9ORTH